jgi:hypothetical protein
MLLSPGQPIALEVGTRRSLDYEKGNAERRTNDNPIYMVVDASSFRKLQNGKNKR